MKVVISQPRYLPAINYLTRLYFSDIFILLDNVQRQARGFENRNKLFLPNLSWLSIPIESSSREVLFTTKISNNSWVDEHKMKIAAAYSSYPNFDPALLDCWYKDVAKQISFVDAIKVYLENVCFSINFKPNMVLASEVLGKEQKYGVSNLVDLVSSISKNEQCECQYISGANGRDYGVKEAFCDVGVPVLFHDWEPERYLQVGQDEFVSFLAFPDLVFNIGIKELEKLVKTQQVFNNE
jgi:hypothetical protein